MLSLFEIFNSSNYCNIIKKDTQLFCQNEKYDSYNITKFQQEFIKVLKNSIQQQNIREYFINDELNSLLNHNSVKFKDLKLLRTQDEIISGYLFLLTEFALGSEEFQIQIENPFVQKQTKDIFNEICATKMTLNEQNTFACENKEWDDDNGIYCFYDLLKKNTKIQQISTEDLVYNIKTSFDQCHCPSDHGRDYCPFPYRSYWIRNEGGSTISFDKIKCKNLYINIENWDVDHFYKQVYDITIPISLNLLQINHSKFKYKGEVEINLKFIENNCYISKMEFCFSQCLNFFEKNYKDPDLDEEQQEECEEIPSNYFKKFLECEQISEYVINFYPNTMSINELIELDQSCDKIIYFQHVKSRAYEYYQQPQKNNLESIFIECRNFLNAMKFQVFAANLLFTSLLNYSPSQTLLDLYFIDS